MIQPPADWVAPSGFCECGCGGKTELAKQARPKWGQYKGYPLRFIHGHDPKGRRAYGWKGGRKIDVGGYVLIYAPDSHLADSNGYVREHRLVWEKANGRRLRPDEDVHHIDGNRQNNAPENLVALTKTQHTSIHATSKTTAARLRKATSNHYKDPEARRKHSERMKQWWAERKSAH